MKKAFFSDSNMKLIGRKNFRGEKKQIDYFILTSGNDKLYAVKYSTVLPSEDILRREIAAQKELFQLQMQMTENMKKLT